MVFHSFDQAPVVPTMHQQCEYLNVSRVLFWPFACCPPPVVTYILWRASYAICPEEAATKFSLICFVVGTKENRGPPEGQVSRERSEKEKQTVQQTDKSPY